MKTSAIISIAVATVLANGLMILGSTKSIRDDLTSVSGRVDDLTTKIEIRYTKNRISLTARERDCLTRNVFEEAGVESHEGKIAVAQVTGNRRKAGRWGKDMCSVIHSPAQFSWTLKPSKLQKTPKGELWEKSRQAVLDYESGARIAALAESKFYHTDYIRTPYWVDPNKKLTKIGAHIFYSEARKAS